MSARAVALAVLMAAPVAAGASKAELQARYQKVIAALGAHNAQGAANGTTSSSAYRTRMMELIGEMQRLQLAIAQAEKAGKPSPWDEMDADQLEAERERLQVQAQAASAAGDGARAAQLWRQVTEVAKVSNLRALQAASGRLPGAGGGGEFVTTVDATRFFEEGDIERGLNAYEAVIAGGLKRDNVAAAINLAGFYLDLVADADKALRLSRRIEEHCNRALGPDLGDLSDEKRRLWVRYRRSARQTVARALAAAGVRRELAEHMVESARLLEAERDAWRADDGVAATIFQVAGHFQLVTGYLVDADLARKRNHDDGAAASSREALAGLDTMARLLSAWPEQDHFEVMNWSNITWFRRSDVLQDMGRTDEALESWERYFEGERRYGKSSKGGHYYALAKVGHARSLAAAGRLEEAIQAARTARARFLGRESEIALIGPYRALAWKPSFLLGQLHRQAGAVDEALRSFEEAVGLIEELYSQMRSGDLKSSFLSFDECGAAYHQMISLHLERGDPASALAVLDRSKSAVLLDMLRSQPMLDRGRWPERLLQRERELKKRLHDLKRDELAPGDGTRSGSAADPESRRKVFQDIELLLREVRQVVKAQEVTSGARKVDAVWAHDSTTLASTASGGRVVVAYFDDGESLRTFVLKGGEIQVYPAGKTRRVSRAADKLRRNVTARSKRWERVARQLYRDLIEPWQGALEGAAELVLVPTGELFALPFAALPDGEGRTLASRLPVSFVSQISLLSAAQDAPRSSLGTLVLADPDGSLPYARVEGAQVAIAAGEGAAALEGAAASEGALKDRVGFLKRSAAPGTLHLATHGLLNKGAHLLSSLVLAPDDLEDGALTFLEIFNDLDLRRTPVVVLSACNTAVGETRGGDEVAGLARAFQYAGADWVVASLWEVSDEASAALMARLHQAMAAGEPVDRALRSAQLALQETDPKWKHPYFWAAFAAYRR